MPRPRSIFNSQFQDLCGGARKRLFACGSKELPIYLYVVFWGGVGQNDIQKKKSTALTKARSPTA
jgi:hypothetical protein